MTSFITCVNCIKGYGYGVKGWKLEGDTLPLAKKDLVEGLKYTIQSFFSIPKNAQSAGYWIATGTVASLKMKKLVEIIGLLLVVSTSTSTSWGIVATRLSRYAKLALLTGVMFTLKDAADRGRLNGTTFMQLNLLSSYVFGSMSGTFLDYVIYYSCSLLSLYYSVLPCEKNQQPAFLLSLKTYND